MADEIKVESTEETVDINALQAELAKLKDENNKLKTSVSNASADASKYKKQWQATLSEQEKTAAEIAEKQSRMEAELATYKTNERISGYKARLMEVGYDSATADVMAKALPEGVGDNYFEVQRAFINTKVATAQSEMLNKQPQIRHGETPDASSIEAEEKAKLRSAFGLI